MRRGGSLVNEDDVLEDTVGTQYYISETVFCLSSAVFRCSLLYLLCLFSHVANIISSHTKLLPLISIYIY